MFKIAVGIIVTPQELVESNLVKASSTDLTSDFLNSSRIFSCFKQALNKSKRIGARSSDECLKLQLES